MTRAAPPRPPGGRSATPPRRPAAPASGPAGRLLRLALLAALALPAPALAQAAADPVPRDDANPRRREATGQDAPRREGPAPPAAAVPERRLPAEATTRHRLDLPGRSLAVVATAGSLRLTDEAGAPRADIAFIAYRLDTPDPARRPVAFAVNGGPGASSAWLQLGALGPWRLPMSGDAATPSAPPALLPNAETWLDFADLVFLDPAGTGFSEVLGRGEEARRSLWSVEGDIRSLAEAIRIWLQRNGRLGSPKFLVGESYGGFRGPRLARVLAEQEGVGLRGLVLVSPVLDFGGRSAFDPLTLVARLPSLAAATRATASGAPPSAEFLAEAERYAAGDYLRDLLRGVRDGEAVERLNRQVAAVTGLDPGFVRRFQGRMPWDALLRGPGQAEGRVASAYDATETRADPFPLAIAADIPDPVLDGLVPPLTSAMLTLYRERLEWLPADRRYSVLNQQVNREWGWGRGGRRGVESLGALRTALALDPALRVVVAHGLYDLVTPYFASRLLLDQIPASAGGDRVALRTFPGGHMFYAADESRAGLREAGQALVEGR
ncbi:S10 family peptidase [Roseomonas cutis]|uniref:S10 family peptidase n=1 Tax=Roseomonas cutis TaxID=2897332 RepID=UPI00272C7028|nr:septum formation initiator [Roseomonas sp. OT10]